MLASIVTAAEPVAGFRDRLRLTGGVFAACGLIAWRRRPDSLTGALMVATGFGLLVEPVFAQVDSPALRLVGDLLEDAWAIPMIALLLTYLSGGRLEGDRRPRAGRRGGAGDRLRGRRHLFLEREGNVLLVHADGGIADAFESAFGLAIRSPASARRR